MLCLPVFFFLFLFLKTNVFWTRCQHIFRIVMLKLYITKAFLQRKFSDIYQFSYIYPGIRKKPTNRSNCACVLRGDLFAQGSYPNDSV